MRKVFLLILLAMVSVMASAQGAKLTGTLVDRDTREPLTQATVQLLKTDSTFITGAISDNNGRFSFTTSASGRFLLKITIIGYQTTYGAS